MDVGDQTALLALIQGMAATAPYLDETKAIEAGYAPTDDCVASPAGAMGFHYVNLDLIRDPAIDPGRPEILLYIPTENGPRLAGFEYVQPIGPPDAPIPDPAPTAKMVGSRIFDGPMLGHGPGRPPHYDLHVWGWIPNPAGTFEGFNPALSCPE